MYKFFLIYLIAGVLAFITFSRAEAGQLSAARVIKCDESKMQSVFIKPNYGTVISFPIKPDNVVLGGKNQFSVEYIKNDLAITALSSNANTNLFVYLLGRRCGFQLNASYSKHESLIKVQDPEETKIKVNIERE
jgi:hypothetical protein